MIEHWSLSQPTVVASRFTQASDYDPSVANVLPNFDVPKPYLMKVSIDQLIVKK